MTDRPTDDHHPDDEPSDDGLTIDLLGAWLRDPHVWSDPPDDLERQVVAAISEHPGGAPARVGADLGTTVDSIVVTHRRRPRWALVAVAACIAVIASVGGLVLLEGGGTNSGVAVALSGTELARTASASATIDSTPHGTRITLDVVDLSPAEPGTYYQAWVSKGDTVVSAGSFHLRRGTGGIELWCGLEDPMDGTLVITVEGYGRRTTPGPSERVVLVGHIRTSEN